MIKSKPKIQFYKKWLESKSKRIKEKSYLYYILSDPTRLKLLLLLRKHKELCVTDLSNILNIGISAASHQLSLLERHGLISKTKNGKIVCYSLDSKVDKYLSTN